ncbi:MAG: prolipoprotein diacylglyceryl transferase [Ruminococcus sp.]|jgi:phosphatidylglycerol:prolipoprotein diacylglycerol transferase|nr:prolipoprotein diacylglyceryl transferase [Ruminococcus sp.]
MNLNEIAFPKLGWEFTVSPDALVIGGFAIKWYAICIAVGVILAYIYAIPRLKKNGLDDDKAFNCVFLGFIGAIIGARAYYVLMTLNVYNWDFLSIINIRDGGLAIYGGIIGAILFAFVASRIWKVRFIPLLDVAAPSFLIGQAIGRWGNFFNQEAFGSNTELPWGMTGGRIQSYLAQNVINIYTDTGVVVDPMLPVHPCFLYESLWCIAGFLLIHFFYSKIRTFDGELILVYAAWYGFGRAAIESFRTDSLMIGNIRVSQLLGVITAVIAVGLIVYLSIRTKKKNIPLYKDTEEAAAVIAAVAAREKEYADKKAEKAAEKAAKKAEKSRELERDLKPDEKLIDDDESEE